jgi:hypothetical protein
MDKDGTSTHGDDGHLWAMEHTAYMAMVGKDDKFATV